MIDTMRRMWSSALMALVLGAIATAPVHAQHASSTWQQIKQRGELRIGVTPGEPWYFKDPASGQWSGIGYRMGQQIAKDLGVKLVPVETTWGNSVAAIQANQRVIEAYLGSAEHSFTDLRRERAMAEA